MTNKERHKRRLTDNPDYKICPNKVEDINHIFKVCRRVKWRRDGGRKPITWHFGNVSLGTCMQEQEKGKKKHGMKLLGKSGLVFPELTNVTIHMNSTLSKNTR